MILVALGANLPAPYGASPLDACRRAAAALDALPGLHLIGLSRWFRTAPVPPSGQPDYVNAVARLRGAADPATLLAALQAIESRAGRVRGVLDAARTLDLDIVAMGPRGALCRTAPDPVLPHPRAHLRAFVLAPLLDVAPDWVHPVLGHSAAALLAALPPQQVTVLAIPGPFA
jgi:2-amino-4-hydroxy-6-hydroxymethyldihydropteridine diphosphokinase